MHLQKGRSNRNNRHKQHDLLLSFSNLSDSDIISVLVELDDTAEA